MFPSLETSFSGSASFLSLWCLALGRKVVCVTVCWWLCGLLHSVGDVVDLTPLLLQVRTFTFNRGCTNLFCKCWAPALFPVWYTGGGQWCRDVIIACSAVSTAQHPGNLCPNHEDNLLGDILCSKVSTFPSWDFNWRLGEWELVAYHWVHGWKSQGRGENWFGTIHGRPVSCVPGQSTDGIYDCQKELLWSKLHATGILWRRNPGKASA